MSSHHHKKHFNAVEIFQSKFASEFLAFKRDADGLARGAFSFNSGWKDWMGVAGLSGVFVTGGAVISGIAIVGIITSVASLGIGLGVSLAAIGAEVAYTLYRSKKKGREFHRASYFLSRENIDDEAELIASLLSDLYEGQLKECKNKSDAEGLALAHIQAIKFELMKNKSFKFDDLLSSGSLQAIIAKNALHVSKKPLEMHAVRKEDCNMQSVITKPALYCYENDKFYAAEHSRPEKYGVLMFSTKEQLDDYRGMVEKVKGHANDWRYSKMRSRDADSLRHGKFFKHHHEELVGDADDKSMDVSFRQR